MASPIPTRAFALYTLGNPGSVAGEDCRPPFSRARYSRYKYGSVTAADVFARALGAAFRRAYPELALAPRLLMASSPYAYVPAAATTLASRLQRVLNALRAEDGLAPVPLLRVDRAGTSAGDYGTLSAPARDRLMAGNVLSFRRFRSAPVRDAHLLLVDDVRVTGAHQRCLMRASADLPLATRTFLYIAAFPGPRSGGFEPTEEDALNHAAVTTLGDLARIVAAGDFAWNVRACKFALSPANHGDLPQFLRRMPHWFVRGLHRNSCRDGYARMAPYAPSHAVLRAELSARAGAPRAVCPPARQDA